MWNRMGVRADFGEDIPELLLVNGDGLVLIELNREDSELVGGIE